MTIAAPRWVHICLKSSVNGKNNHRLFVVVHRPVWLTETSRSLCPSHQRPHRTHHLCPLLHMTLTLRCTNSVFIEVLVPKLLGLFVILGKNTRTFCMHEQMGSFSITIPHFSRRAGWNIRMITVELNLWGHEAALSSHDLICCRYLPSTVTYNCFEQIRLQVKFGFLFLLCCKGGLLCFILNWLHDFLPRDLYSDSSSRIKMLYYVDSY